MANRSGIILAGGQSKRMGKDKGFILWNGKAFAQHVIDVLRPLTDEIIIVSDNPAYDFFQTKRVQDIIKNSGPLAGLHAGLTHASSQNCLVLSCDIPLISAKVLEVLLTYENSEHDAVQVQSRGKTMPLIALYRKHCSEKCQELLQKKQKRLQALASELNMKTVPLEKGLEQYTANINSPQELEKLCS